MIRNKSAAHKAARPRRRTRRLAIMVAGLVLVPLAAFAAWLLLKGFTGEVTVTGGSLSLEAASVDAAGTTAGTCNATVQGDKVLVSMAGYPGDTCTVVGKYIARGTNMRAQSADWSGDSDIVDAELATCGTEVRTNNSQTPVRVTLTISDQATPGDSIPADETAGITFVPADQYDEGDCS